MKVAITASWGDRLGGAEELLWTSLQGFDPARIDPIVVFLERGPFEHEVASLGVRTAVLDAGRLRNAARAAATVARLAALLRRERPDLLLDWTPKAHLYGAPAAAIARVPTAWWQHGIPSGHWLDRLASALPARAAIASSPAAARAQGPRAIAVEPGTSPPPDGPVAAIDAAEGELVAVIVGRLQPGKRQDLLVRAAADLPFLRVLVVGGTAHGLSPEYAPLLRRLAADLGVEDRVVFTGQVDDVTPYVRRADVLVNASDREAFGLVLPEAMALSTPVVTFDSGGPSAIVEDGVSGLVLRGADPLAELVAALRLLHDDARLRVRLGAGGRLRWEERYTAEQFVERLTSTLERVAARASGARRA